MKYSIIIPTYNNLNECLSPCLESLLAHTPQIVSGECEVIVVSNGCTDGTDDYVRVISEAYPTVRLLSYPDPLGYTRAVNTGLGVATGEFVVLLNNDCKVLDFRAPGEWLEMLAAPFADPTVGITGPSRLFSKEADAFFLVFFLVMIPRRLFFEIGYLDETFNPGGGEDIDFCLRLSRAGYKQVKVPDDTLDWSYNTSFPIYHAGEKTVHTMVDGWEEKFAHRMGIIERRRKRGYYSDFADVTCEISTRGRYFTTLPMAIMSVVHQELKPKRLIIFMDDHNDGAPDLREHTVYQNLFGLLDKAGIRWEVLFGEGKGQTNNHQKALEMSETEWVWRLDDDTFAEPDVLRILMEETDDEVGAVAPSVLDAGATHKGAWSTALPDINTHLNVQWCRPGMDEADVVEADHLYSTFIYRRAAAIKNGYDVGSLSRVGHREETIFTHRMKRDGWKLLVARRATIWHLREARGGIREESNKPDMWASDEEYFKKLLIEWESPMEDVVKVNLDGGKGDHYMFRMALPQILEANQNKKIIVYCSNPECFDDETVQLDLRSVAEGRANVPNFDSLNVYHWCDKYRWAGSLVDAYKKIYC